MLTYSNPLVHSRESKGVPNRCVAHRIHVYRGLLMWSIKKRGDTVDLYCNSNPSGYGHASSLFSCKVQQGEFN